jgi:hypothetical protein
MAKGSVRKKGKKWYYRFYVEDARGNLIQKEYAGTESKSETESFCDRQWRIMKAKSLSQQRKTLPLHSCLTLGLRKN